MSVQGVGRRLRAVGSMAVAVTFVVAASIAVSAPPAAGAVDGPFNMLNRRNYQCLDVIAFNSADGAQIAQWWCNGAVNQSWYFTYGSAPNYPAQVRSNFSGKCMDVIAANYTPGAAVAQWTCNGSPQQNFQLETIGLTGSGNRIFALHPAANWNLCLDVLGANNDYGAPVGLWTCNRSYNQQFIIDMI